MSNSTRTLPAWAPWKTAAALLLCAVQLAAGALLAIVPMAVLYLFLQKYFVRGMVESAFK